MSKAELSSAIARKLQSYEVMSPDQYELFCSTGRAADLTRKFKPFIQEWDYANPCPHCQCIFLKSSKRIRKLCCGSGKYLDPSSPYPHLFPMPQYLLYQVLGNTEHFSKISARYNKRLSIAATGVNHESSEPSHGYERIHGPHAVKIQGRTYHVLPPVASNRGLSQGLSFMVFDSSEEVEEERVRNGGRRDEDVLPAVLRGLKQELCECNKYSHELAAIGNKVRQAAAANPQARCLIPVPWRKTSVFEVGAILSDSSSGQLTVEFKLNGEKNILNGMTPLTEPLVYPLLFPFGENGWHQGIAAFVPAHAYLASRILMPEQGRDAAGQSTVMKCRNAAGTHLLATNRFQLMARLKQFYLIETLSRFIDSRLDWIRQNQRKFKVSDPDQTESSSDEEEDEEKEGEEEEEGVFLSSSFTGSPRHLKTLAHNAMHTVLAVGKPTVFITATCNPEWKEIPERLFKGQTAFDREDIVCEVFHARIEALLHNIRAGKYFGGATVIYEMKVIEYQHRGLPHAHIVVRLSNAPDHNNELECQTWIDNYISATIPSPQEAQLDERQHRLRTLIQAHMTHVCSRAENGCIKNGVCKRGYVERLPQQETKFDYRGYPKYRRPAETDSNVVPHSPDILLDWDGHINVEFAAKTFAVLYLYKYIFKGNTKSRMRFENPEEEKTKDEVKLYLRGRTLSAMDCMWRSLGYQNYPKAIPSVRVVKVLLPHEMGALQRENKLCELAVYFLRPPCLHHLTYCDFCKHWGYQYRSPPVTCKDYHRATFQGRILFIYAKSKTDTIVRLGPVPWYIGEKYHLRTLLLHVPAASYQELKHPFNTFQESVLHRQLMKKSGEALKAFQEAILVSTPRQLRSLFIVQTMQGFPTIQIFNDLQLREAMYMDYLMNDICRGNHELALNFMLKDLAKAFKEENKTLSDYGLPDVNPDLDTEIAIQKRKYECQQQVELLESLNQAAPNNPQQQELYDIIKTALDEKNTLKVFLQGQGGSGKSTFAKKVMALARSQDLIALGCASTGLAAQVYGSGEFETAHSLFGIPVIEDFEDYENEGIFVSSKLTPESDRFQLLMATSLIVWDEFLSNHQHCLDAASRLLNNFNGKVLLCMGDCRQIAPVVPHSSDPMDTLRASMLTSHHWSKFRIFEFTTNMRLLGLRDSTADPESSHRERCFAQTLLNVGNADYTSNCDNCHILHEVDNTTQYIRLPILNYFTQLEDVIGFLYPQGFSTASLEKRAILAGTNLQCDHWNTVVQELNPGREQEYISTNTLCDIDDLNNTLESMLTDYVLSRYESPQVAPHRLLLKVGDICLVVRTLNCKRDQISTNTRVRITRLFDNAIQIRTLGSNPRQIMLPRIKFKFRLPWGHSFYMLRSQFPLKLAYSMTFNKSQGQEFDKVVLDSISPVFSHGFLYVGMSRVRHSSNLAFYTNPDNIHDDAIVVQNVVYKSLLLNSEDNI